MARAPPVDIAVAATNTTLLPPSSLRDITAIVFILLALPQLVSCVIFLMYILSGSSKLIGGRFVAKHFLFRKSYKIKTGAPEDSPYDIYASKIVAALLQAFFVNGIIIMALFHFVPTQWPIYLAMMAKSIIASEMIGSAYKNTTSITSVSSSTATSTTTTTTIKRLLGTHPPRQRQTPSGTLKYALMGFVLVFVLQVCSHRATQALEHTQIPPLLYTLLQYSWLPKLDDRGAENMVRRYAKHVATLAPSAGSLRRLMHRRLAASSTGRSALVAGKKYLPCYDHTAAYITRASSYLEAFLNYTYLVLCVHVITLTISPHFHKIVLLKNYSKTLDDLSSLTPSSDIDFKRNLLLAKTKRSEADGEPVVINVEQPQKTIQTIAVGPEIASSALPVREVTLSVASRNFETFCMSSFKSTPANPAVMMKPHKSTSVSKVPPQVPNSTTIVDRDVVNFTTTQPFWSLLAATKAIIKRPEFFVGEATRRKNNGGKFLTTGLPPKVPVAVCFIDSQSVVLKVVLKKDTPVPEAGELAVRVNRVGWIRTSVHTRDKATYFCIFGLSPLSQYEIEIFAGDETLCHVVCSTVSAESHAVLSQSQPTSSFETLQQSVIAAINGLSQLRAEFKKLKRDEHRKITDLKKERDFVQSRIAKYNLTLLETKSSGKTKGLQNSVVQFENEVRDLRQKLSSSSNTLGKTETEYRAEEDEYEERIAEASRNVDSHEAMLLDLRKTLKTVAAEAHSLESKRQKLANKEASRLEEVQKIAHNVEAMKETAVLGRLRKRHKRASDKFEGIMAKIASATADVESALRSYTNE